VNEHPAGARQLDRADYALLDASGAPARQGVSLFNRSGLMQCDTAGLVASIAALDRDAAQDGRFVAASLVYAGASGAVAIAGLARSTGLRVFELNVGATDRAQRRRDASVRGPAGDAGTLAGFRSPRNSGASIVVVRTLTCGSVAS
jgi:hypothetical protein